MELFVHSKNGQVISLSQKNYGDTNTEVSLIKILTDTDKTTNSKISSNFLPVVLHLLLLIYLDSPLQVFKYHLVCERTMLWQYPKCAMEEEITQWAWSTDQCFILKSTTVCGYNFGSCTVPHSVDLLLLLHTFAMAAILEEQSPVATSLLICIITSHII